MINKIISQIQLIVFVFIACQIQAQTSKNPVVIKLSSPVSKVVAGEKNYIKAQIKIPKGIWLGADKGEARTPPGTKIIMPKINGFNFEEAQYPESIKEWVPAKLGDTQVFKEMVNVIIPYTVENGVSEGTYQLDFKFTYTPGYNAGRLATHNNEIHSITINVDNNAKAVTSIPEPSMAEVSGDFYVNPKSYDDVPPAIKFLYKPFNEDGGLAKALHSVWLDKPGHGKSVRFMPTPFLSSSNIEGSSIGMGVSFFNSTKEGTMTGLFSMSGYYNNLIGGAFGLQAISCPGAYHNYQFSAFFGGEGYRDVSLRYENLTLVNAKFGYELNLKSINEPRTRYFGTGPLTAEEDETAYENTNLNAVIDLYALPMQNLRIGVGIGYDNYDIGSSFDRIRTEEGIPFLEDSPLFNGALGLGGANAFQLRANIVFDHRDQEFASSRGFYGKMTFSRTNLSNTESEAIADSFTGLDVDMRQYFSGPSQKLIVLMRAGLSLKSESNLPFYMLSSLGGPTSARAYDEDRFLGQHSAFGSAEMRYTLTTIPVLGYPMSIEMGAFLDIGQVFGDEETLGSELNVDPGISMRMINKPNVGLILNYAFGEDGGYFTGGIGLPF